MALIAVVPVGQLAIMQTANESESQEHVHALYVEFNSHRFKTKRSIAATFARREGLHIHVMGVVTTTTQKHITERLIAAVAVRLLLRSG